ncbi:HSP20-like chaperone [Terfezia claveryi]|nr:HSP20-like chaperone [Terfezia claveryi]
MAPQVTPEVLWAQRSSATDPAKNIVYLTINAVEITPESCKCEITPTGITFSGTNNKEVNYAVDLEFYDEIVPEESKKHITSRGAEFVLRKKELKTEFWPRLLKESKRMHFLKTDFDKWVDEDEQEEKGSDDEDEDIPELEDSQSSKPNAGIEEVAEEKK